MYVLHAEKVEHILECSNSILSSLKAVKDKVSNACVDAITMNDMRLFQVTMSVIEKKLAKVENSLLQAIKQITTVGVSATSCYVKVNDLSQDNQMLHAKG
jgi:hypothetical protein